MIERRVVDGRVATLVFLDDDFKVVNILQATQAKAVFDDGEVMWMEVEECDPIEQFETVDDFLERMEAYWEGA